MENPRGNISLNSSGSEQSGLEVKPDLERELGFEARL